MCIMLSLLLAQPSGSNIVVKVLWFVQWPFSLLRWMSVPPFGYVSVDSYCFWSACILIASRYSYSAVPMIFYIPCRMVSGAGGTMYLLPSPQFS